MYKIHIPCREIQESLDLEDPWGSIYEDYKSIYQASIGKMLGKNPRYIFATDRNIKKFAENLCEYEKRRDRIKEIIEKSMKICPAKEGFNVFFLPVPVDDYMIITQYSKNLGAFIFFGVGESMESMNLDIFLPHEYAHVVRLQRVMIPAGIHSPYQMTFGDLALFEGLGVVFSCIFNGDAKKDTWKYIPIRKGEWDKVMENEKYTISQFKKMKDTKITPETISTFYEKREGYIIGSIIVWKLLEKSDICTLSRTPYSSIQL